MIWFDVEVILLLTLRMVFFDQRWQATMGGDERLG
jgi:hypothetical protein